MDDLKVYAKGKERLGATLEMVDRVSKAIGMKLGLRKCAVHMSGQKLQTADYTLPDGGSIVSLTDGNADKYLGIQQIFQPDLKAVKKRIVRLYITWLRTIWRSELNAQHKITATNVWAVSVFQYFFLKWMKRELEALDCKTRSVLRQVW